MLLTWSIWSMTCDIKECWKQFKFQNLCKIHTSVLKKTRSFSALKYEQISFQFSLVSADILMYFYRL